MSSPLNTAPPHLSIRILHADDDVIVIEKPCDLRSVPGHANSQPIQKRTGLLLEDNAEESSSSQRRTSQEAWVKAIEIMSEGAEGTRSITANEEGVPMEDTAINELQYNLATTANPSCVPRKLETFIKYCSRNAKRLFPSYPTLHDDYKNIAPRKDDEEHQSEPPSCKKQKLSNTKQKNKGNQHISPMMRSIAQTCYTKIQQIQIPLMNLPTPTEDRESAIGQLRQLGYGDIFGNESSCTNKDKDSSKKLHTVHRLDCQTSGIMVVARNQFAASTLCQAWRERDSVQKIYLAHVMNWPPYHKDGQSEGHIDIPLAPSRSERIKWETRPAEDGGKPSKTYWKVYEDYNALSNANGNEGKGETSSNNNSTTYIKHGITLELHPITGRTHQLRLHCAAIGSGIVGDSLYGDSPIAWVGDSAATATATEHANQIQEGVNSAKLSAIGSADQIKTLRLHAHRLEFAHPTTGKKLTFESPKLW